MTTLWWRPVKNAFITNISPVILRTSNFKDGRQNQRPLLDLRIHSEYYCGVQVIRYIANLHEVKQFCVTGARNRGENSPAILYKFEEGLIVVCVNKNDCCYWISIH